MMKLVGYVCPFCGYISKKVEYVKTESEITVFPSKKTRYNYEKYLLFKKCKHVSHMYGVEECALYEDSEKKIIKCSVLKRFTESFIKEWKARRKFKEYDLVYYIY